MHINHEFCLATAQRLAPPGGRILDYGCGAGEIVAAGVARGLDLHGTDLFYEGGNYREEAERTGMLGSRIRELGPEGRIPFPDGHFDVVFHNMVFEHVPDLEPPLREIARVLKPGGAMLSVFPSATVLRDGHCNLWLAHRFRRDSVVGLRYMTLMRRLGAGSFHDGKPPEQWARDFLDWINDWCYYRSRREILSAYRRHGFTWEPREADYVGMRLEAGGHPRLAAVARAVPALTNPLTRLVLSEVFVSRLSAVR